MKSAFVPAPISSLKRPVGYGWNPQPHTLPDFPFSHPPHRQVSSLSRGGSPLASARHFILASAVTQPRPVVGFVHLFLSFIAGGVFFGAVFAGITTFVAVGKSNISRIWSVTKSVIDRVWTVFCFGLNETRLALRMDGKWQWREAWKTFKSKMGETRQAAAEGMDAIKAEKNFYAGVVGQPGLITIQYFLTRLLPFSLTTQMENALINALKGVKNKYIARVTLLDFKVGGVPPTLLEARNYDLGEDALAFDVDVKWESEADVKMNVYTKKLGLRVKVTARNACFDGTARVILSPLTKEPPGWGAILISMPSVPIISLDVQAAGTDMTKIPWLKREIINGLEQQIEDQFLWPKRIVLPSLAVPPTARTVIPKKELDQLKDTDPLLQRENMLAQNVALKEHVDKMKPNVASLSSNLNVTIGNNTVTIDVNGEAEANETNTGKNKKWNLFSKHDTGKKEPFLYNLIPHYRNTSKSRGKTETH